MFNDQGQLVCANCGQASPGRCYPEALALADGWTDAATEFCGCVTLHHFCLNCHDAARALWEKEEREHDGESAQLPQNEQPQVEPMDSNDQANMPSRALPTHKTMQSYLVIYRLAHERQMHVGITNAFTPQEAAGAVQPGAKIRLIATAAQIRNAIAGAADEDAPVFVCSDKSGATWLAQVNSSKEQWSMLNQKGARILFALRLRALRQSLEEMTQLHPEICDI